MALGCKGMKMRPASIWLIATALPLVACKPSQRLPVTGEVKLEFIGKNATDINFKLKNQASKQISFWGARDWWWAGVFPIGPRFECVLANPNQMHESPFPLIDGAWKEFVVAPSEQIDITVDSYYLRGRDGRLPTGRCRFLLQLEGGSVLKSEEFESMDTSS
jgi:hypothetical protein